MTVTMPQLREALLAQLERAVSGVGLNPEGVATERVAAERLVAERAAPGRAPAVHDLRRQMKCARATLRLLRAAVGEKEFRRDDRVIRDAARHFGTARDAQVLLRTFNSLAVRPTAAGEAEFNMRVLQQLEEECHASGAGPARRPPAEAAMRRVQGRAAAIRRLRLRPATPGKALKDVYKAGRKAFAKVCRKPSDERWHEWRKQVKYLFNQIDVLASLGGRRFAKMRRRSRLLADCLGEDHDLAMLVRKIDAMAGSSMTAAERAARRALRARVEKHRGVLQKKARRLGRRLYARKPKRLARRADEGGPRRGA